MITSINELSDNGKSFEFGYDSDNDVYGYYNDGGTFMAFGGSGYRPKKFVATMFFSYSSGSYADSNGYIMTGDLYDYLVEHEEIPFYLKTRGARAQYVVFREVGYMLTSATTQVSVGQEVYFSDTHYGAYFGFVYNVDPYDS